MIKKEEIIKILEKCYDPEIPIDVWNLGLIYNMKIEKNSIDIIMTLTTPGCTMADHISDNIKKNILDNSNAKDVNITITFDPIWEPNMMTEQGKVKLGFKSTNQTNNNENWE